MISKNFEIPIVLIFYKRLDTVVKVLESIRQIMPKKLYLVSDGAKNIKGEKEKIEVVRGKLEALIDWPCEVHKNYSKINMGCEKRVKSGLDWVFSKEEMAVILEDDILPNQKFYCFMEMMLNYYKDDKRIMIVSGCNLVPRNKIKYDYTFSYFSGIWGWGTWKRAWELYEGDYETWVKIRDSKLLYHTFEVGAANIYTDTMNYVYKGKIKSWAYKWLISRIWHSGLGIVPRDNMIVNIGFGENATNTLGDSIFKFDLNHSMKDMWILRESIYRDFEYDRMYIEKVLYPEHQYSDLSKENNTIIKKIYTELKNDLLGRLK